MKPYILSLTSWSKRINNVGMTIYIFLRNTIPPEHIYLNLSREEFPYLFDSLPNDLIQLVKLLPNKLTINFLPGNTKAFKKVIPTLQSHKTDDVYVISADDDWYYSPYYAEYMLSLISHYPNNYFTPGTWGSHVHGYAMIYDPNWFHTNLLYSLNSNDMNNIVASDVWISECLRIEGIKPMVVPYIENFIRDLNISDKLSDTYTQPGFMESCRRAVIKCTQKYFRKI